jgi:hypothetical protein
VWTASANTLDPLVGLVHPAGDNCDPLVMPGVVRAMMKLSFRPT